MRRFVSSDFLGHNTKPKTCAHDQQLDAVVHRFNLGARKCRCGELDLPEPPGRMYYVTPMNFSSGESGKE